MSPNFETRENKELKALYYSETPLPCGKGRIDFIHVIAFCNQIRLRRLHSQAWNFIFEHVKRARPYFILQRTLPLENLGKLLKGTRALSKSFRFQNISSCTKHFVVVIYKVQVYLLLGK